MSGELRVHFPVILAHSLRSGIGQALAAKLVENGVSVIAVGRRKERLEDFAKQHGSNSKATVDTAVFDIEKLQEIPGFAKDMFSKHPDLDCIFLNSGMQRAVNWAEPEKVDLSMIEKEMMVNYTSYMHLNKAFLPYLMKQAPNPTAIIYTTSGLALVPIMTVPNYCATKAALHHMILVMRQQLKDAKSNVKIIELYPPAVQTELHDAEMGDKGKHVGMPLKDFTEEAWEGLSSDDNEQVPVQMVKDRMGFNSWEQERQKTFHGMVEMMKKMHQ